MNILIVDLAAKQASLLLASAPTTTSQQHLQALEQMQRALQSQAQNRKSQDAGACESGAPIPGNQTPVRLRENSLARILSEVIKNKKL